MSAYPGFGSAQAKHVKSKKTNLITKLLFYKPFLLVFCDTFFVWGDLLLHKDDDIGVYNKAVGGAYTYDDACCVKCPPLYNAGCDEQKSHRYPQFQLVLRTKQMLKLLN